MASFEAYADKRADVGEFYTVTCPGRMHPRLQKSGGKNSNFDGSSPRDGQTYLCRQWARARSALKRAGISMYGFRIAEPHHDGTPHWHLLLFMAPDEVETVRTILHRYAFQTDPDEPDEEQDRFRAVRIDRTNGTATGYVAKYVSKNIDGFGLPETAQRADTDKPAIRVDAWASTWGIRQFQQIGGPPVGVWRELRTCGYELSGELEAARQAADAGNWCGIIEATERAAAQGCRIQTASVWNDKPGQYGDPVGAQVIGVTAGALTVVTRKHEWEISFKGRSTSQVPWSSVNNCTMKVLDCPSNLDAECNNLQGPIYLQSSIYRRQFHALGLAPPLL